MAIERFTEYERGGVFSYLQNITMEPNVGTMVQALWTISASHCQLPLQDIEDILQEIGCPMWLLALPVDPNGEFVAKLPHTDEREYPYYINIFIGTEHEMTEQLLYVGMTPKESYALLPQSGILQPHLRRG